MIATRPLGRTALRVSELGFGAAPIGNLTRPTPPDVAAAAVEAAWDLGVRYFDTAPHYGLGLSERRLGRALAVHPRGEYVVSTKVGRLLVANDDPTGSDLPIGGFAVTDDLRRELDYSADGVRRSLDASLERLGLDRIDIVLVHDPDDFVDQVIAETIPALIRLRDEGVVGAVGVGMNQWQAPLRMVEQTDLDTVMVAGRWTLIDRGARPLLDACADRGIGILAAAPYNSGLLANDRPAPGAFFDYAPASAELVARANDLADGCARFDVTLPTAAIQFPLRHPAVASVVSGLRSPEHVQAAADRLATPIPHELWTRLG